MSSLISSDMSAGSAAASAGSADSSAGSADCPAGAVDSCGQPATDELELAAVLQALSDPMRLRIVVALSGGAELSCKSIDLPVVKSTCTHHFRVLREAGVIRQRHEGTSRLNSLRRADLDQRFPGLLDAVLGAAHN